MITATARCASAGKKSEGRDGNVGGDVGDAAAPNGPAAVLVSAAPVVAVAAAAVVAVAIVVDQFSEVMMYRASAASWRAGGRNNHSRSWARSASVGTHWASGSRRNSRMAMVVVVAGRADDADADDDTNAAREAKLRKEDMAPPPIPLGASPR